MPMAHNVKPVKLDMTDNIEGQYEFIIELEMLGEWMFSYDLQTPKKLRLMEKWGLSCLTVLQACR